MQYTEIKSKQPVLFECFFAFSNEQLAKGIAEHHLEGKKLFSGGMGLYGTKEGISRMFEFYDAINAEVAEKCDPQEVYDYEYNNHECSYTCTDTEVMQIVVSYFGEERSAQVKRRHAVVGIKDLNFSIY